MNDTTGGWGWGVPYLPDGLLGSIRHQDLVGHVIDPILLYHNRGDEWQLGSSRWLVKLWEQDGEMGLSLAFQFLADGFPQHARPHVGRVPSLA